MTLNVDKVKQVCARMCMCVYVFETTEDCLSSTEIDFFSFSSKCQNAEVRL